MNRKLLIGVSLAMLGSVAVLKAEAAHLLYRDFIKNQPLSTWHPGGGLRKFLGYGGQF